MKNSGICFCKGVLDKGNFLDKKISYYEYVLEKLRHFDNKNDKLRFLGKILSNKKITQILRDADKDWSLRRFLKSNQHIEKTGNKVKTVREAKKRRKAIRYVETTAARKKRLRRFMRDEDVKAFLRDDKNVDEIENLLDEELSKCVHMSFLMLDAYAFCRKIVEAASLDQEIQLAVVTSNPNQAGQNAIATNGSDTIVAFLYTNASSKSNNNDELRQTEQTATGDDKDDATETRNSGKDSSVTNDRTITAIAFISVDDFIKMGGQLTDVRWQIDNPSPRYIYNSFFTAGGDKIEGYTRLLNEGFRANNGEPVGLRTANIRPFLEPEPQVGMPTENTVESQKNVTGLPKTSENGAMPGDGEDTAFLTPEDVQPFAKSGEAIEVPKKMRCATCLALRRKSLQGRHR